MGVYWSYNPLTKLLRDIQPPAEKVFVPPEYTYSQNTELPSGGYVDGDRG